MHVARAKSSRDRAISRISADSYEPFWFLDLQKVDDILILDNGRIREYGHRSDLVADPNSQFSQLLKAGMEELIV